MKFKRAMVLLTVTAGIGCETANDSSNAGGEGGLGAGGDMAGQSGTAGGGGNSGMAGGGAGANGNAAGAAGNAGGGSAGAKGGAAGNAGGGGSAGAKGGAGGNSGGAGGNSGGGGTAAAGGNKAFDSAAYNDVLRFDFSGENGVPYGNGKAPFAKSIGYPAGVPNGYNWKFSAGGTPDVAAPLNGRGTQTAGAAYDQVYQRRPGDVAAPNARVLLEPVQTYYFSKSKKMWIKVERQSVSGAAFAEDFKDNQSTGADARDEANGSISVRSGSNAAGQAGGVTGRTTDDGPVGYNYHGFDKRFGVEWSDVTAIIVTEVMSCIPDSAAKPSDCGKTPYIANVGLDSWAAVGSDFDGFKTHGGVGGGRFKPVTEERQLFTNYNGPLSLLDTNPPPVPEGF